MGKSVVETSVVNLADECTMSPVGNLADECTMSPVGNLAGGTPTSLCGCSLIRNTQARDVGVPPAADKESS